MKTLGNIIWHFPFFGFLSAIFNYLLGLLLVVTIVGAPIGLGLIEYGKFLFWPFGNAMISNKELNSNPNKLWDSFGFFVRIVYFPFGLAFCVLAAMQVVFLCITIVGIPAGMVVAKSLGTYFNPVNKKCVHSAVVEEIERRKAQTEIDKHLKK